MSHRSNEDIVRQNVADQFRSLIDRFGGSSMPRDPEMETHVKVAFEAWQAGEDDSSTSLLLDVLIRLIHERSNPEGFASMRKIFGPIQ
jgi:hypothetical protein